ncbi:hypothetical protein Poli38472_010438 [Pythium oligandrum]|uniref:Calmodulin-lysine N-methyltransferase n=1 Tax=Pythium oligandrum TaxID=41045 RepID=A0A8K1C330_PYTOL|nr:hypothetical protein Poli38472_010438 [Pythium oligandrum]|eukprot:TMW55556.1 hypothetical protein Poli38472_010438 [Pythium oligandrum]
MAPTDDATHGVASESPAAVLISQQVRVEDQAADSAHVVDLQFQCDWDIGIGGSVWTSGEILTAHLASQQEHYRSIFQDKVVVELGSGTGFVGLMTAVCFQPSDVIVTDLQSHVECLQHNITRNAHHFRDRVRVDARELSWGSSEHEDALVGSFGAGRGVDIILGTDVAYLRELYEPLLHTLRRLAHSKTLILLGLNRADTGMTFFRRLEEEGFEYYKIADRLLPSEYRGKDFGLFEIRPRPTCRSVLHIAAS